MSDHRPETGSTIALPKEELNGLLQGLQARGFETYGPSVRNRDLTYGPIDSLEDLPFGYSTESQPGRFEFSYTDNARYFQAVPGGDSWKKFLFPPRTSLFTSYKENGGFAIKPHEELETLRALIGVRPCDLAAIDVQDRVFLRDDFTDPVYKARRENLFILSVDCHVPCSTAFCHSMGTGPKAEVGFDLALAELDEVFLVRVGSELGADVLRSLQTQPATAYQQRAADNAVEQAIAGMGRKVQTEGLPELLQTNLNNPRWEQVADRCLNCTNCTLVCPTCFCWDIKDETNLTGDTSERVRLWDSCFNPDHSYHAGGGSNRPTVCSRYRQWLTHKLGTWVEQFGVFGCVGCGRCITWCPSGIDITEEVAAIRQEVQA